MLCAAALCSCAAHADNLLDNPSFERLAAGMPVGWALYVVPQEGAAGRVVRGTAWHGDCAAYLRVPEAPDNDALNNWSQNIIAELGGKTLAVRGRIKTEDATEAAILIQCFRKRPVTVLKAKTTSADAAIWGTHDWTPVEMQIVVPQNTDFITCRCLLKGQGAAWFDAIEVNEETGPPETDHSAERDDQAPPSRKSEETKPSEPVKADANEVFAASQQALIEANRALRQTNRLLADRVALLDAELETLREQLLALQQLEPLVVPAPSRPRLPPLVPHGYDTRRDAHLQPAPELEEK